MEFILSFFNLMNIYTVSANCSIFSRSTCKYKVLTVQNPREGLKMFSPYPLITSLQQFPLIILAVYISISQINTGMEKRDSWQSYWNKYYDQHLHLSKSSWRWNWCNSWLPNFIILTHIINLIEKTETRMPILIT